MSELDTRLASSTERGPDAHRWFEPLVEELRTPTAAFLRPELEQRLARYVAADDSFARDQIAHVLAGACGAAALPALMRARMSDRNEDGDALEVVVLELFHAWPEESLRLTLDFASSCDPRARIVGLWGLCVTALDATPYVGTVTSAASDPDLRVRAYAMGTLSTIFGAGYPPATLAVLADGTRDPASEVRRAAVRALGWNRNGTVIDLLVARAEDTDRSVRFEAVFALAHQSDPAARAALERLTTDEDANVRDSARRALAPPTGWPSP
ncbi:HEAT repeat domain-containing protein [Streptomyces sp. NPDC000075]|uniref:HEAT repeat domain-containing protein n=1 Tax=Streptomyces TaxID=1883 RepID=UPI0031E49632